MVNKVGKQRVGRDEVGVKQGRAWIMATRQFGVVETINGRGERGHLFLIQHAFDYQQARRLKLPPFLIGQSVVQAVLIHSPSLGDVTSATGPS